MSAWNYGSSGTLTGSVINTGTIGVWGGPSHWYPATLTIAQGFVNEGLISLYSREGGCGSTATLRIDSGALSNAATGVVRTDGTAGNNFIDGSIDNEGRIEIRKGTTLTNTGHSLDTSTGTIDIASHSTLAITEGGSVQLGSGTHLSGGGTLRFDGTQTIELTSDWLYDGGAALDLAGTVTIDGPGTLINNGTLYLTDDTVAADLEIRATVAVSAWNYRGTGGARI